MQVKYMNSPTKSDEDKKEYRVIKLQNGLTATLISYLNNENAEDKATKKNQTASQFGKMAACALCVKVGSFSDPPQAQGLAHFLEHMVYLGSSKYPQKNEFDTFLTSHGGFGNALTHSERTVFFFTIPDPHFLEALDRFVHFLTDPLLNSDSINEECEILESEFRLHFSDDSHKTERLIYLSLKESHPGKQFSLGNNESLRSLSNAELQSELNKFRSKYYSAHQMTLAIQVCQPLDTIEGYVKDYFTNIPTNDLPALNFPEFNGVSSFDLDAFHKIYKFKPTDKTFMIQLSWPRPPTMTTYRSKPVYYVSWLIGYEGSGSLLSFLRHKLWATDLSAGTELSNSIYSLFQIKIYLTDQGSHHIPEVCNAVFSFLNLLKGINPSRRIFEEIQHIEEVCFRFKPEESPINNVGYIASCMTLFPPEDYLTGSKLLFEYDPREIMKILGDLDPLNVNLIIYDPKSEEEQFEREEYWLKIKYDVEDIPSRWVEQWKIIEPFVEFHLPEPNPFLTTDFSLVSLPERVPAYPEKIFEDGLVKVWYKPDYTFRGLESFFCLSLKTYLMNTSPYNSAMGDMLNTIMQRMMKDEVYAATCTGLEHNLCTSDRGILVIMNGWSQKLPLLLDHIIKYYTKVCSTITEDIFSIGKADELRWYHNKLLDPDELMRELTQMILQTNHWSKTAKWAALKEVTYERFLYFVNHIWDNLDINFLAQGNVTAEHAVQYGLKCVQILNPKPLITETKFWTRICQIPLGEHCCRVRGLDPSNPNSIVQNYYQAEDASLKNKAIIEILTTIMEQPLFNQMRTDQQLGYSVSCDLENNYGIFGLSIKICFQNTKFSSSVIDERIETFISAFKDTLTQMSLQEFEKIKKTLIGLKEVEDYNLEEEFSRNFLEVELGRFAFDKLSKDVDAISEISLDEVEKWFEDHTLGGKKCRKISFQIVGNSGDEEDKNSEGLKIKFMNDSKVEKCVGYFITDIDTFKMSLMLYPISHTLYQK